MFAIVEQKGFTVTEKVIRDEPEEPFLVVEIDGESFEEGDPATADDPAAREDFPEPELDA